MQKSRFLLKFFGFLQTILFTLFIPGLVLLTVFPGEIMAQGNLLIMPRRVVFEGSKKSADLTLANTGTDTAKYVVSIVQMRMKADGSFEQITAPDSGQLFADKYVRFFPRTVSLAPSESQTIKMQLNKADKLPAGEYRSHIYFRSVPKQTALGEEANPKDTTLVSIKMVPVFGITIPVIIRVGETSAKVTLSDVGLEMVNDTLPRINMKFTRTGNISVYGDITVDYISQQGKVIHVANVKGVAIYTPNTYRGFQCNLERSSGVDYHKGKLQITYISQSELKPSKLAEAEIQLH
jgi:P pilus assembly chaperone PapD